MVNPTKHTPFNVPSKLESSLNAAVSAADGELCALPSLVDKSPRSRRRKVERKGTVKVEVELALDCWRAAPDLAKVEHVGSGDLLPGRLLSVQEGGEVLRVSHSRPPRARVTSPCRT